MPDLRRDVGLARDAERLVQRLVDLPAFISHVRRVHAAVTPRRFRERDDLLGRSVDGGSILDGCGETQRTLQHRGIHQGDHVRQLFGCRVAVLPAHDRHANLRRADERRDVDGAFGAREVREIAVQIAPVLLDVVPLHPHGILRDEHVGEGRDRAALARHFRGDALGDLAEESVVDQDVRFRLPQHVDEAWGNDQPRDIEGLARSGGSEVPDRGDPIARDGDVARIARVAAAVHNPAAAQDDVVATGAAVRGAETGGGEQHQE